MSGNGQAHRIVGPVDRLTERQLVGGLLWGGDWWEASALVSSDDLTDPDCRLIWDTIRTTVEEEGTQPGLLGLYHRLDRQVIADRGVGWLHDLASVGHTKVGRLARTVADLAARRTFIEVCRRGATRVADGQPIEEARDATVSGLLATDSGGDGLVPADAVYEQSMRLLDSPRRPGKPTGWKELDRYYSVVARTLTVITGVPGHGKSQWADCLLLRLVRDLGWTATVWAPESGPPGEHAHRLRQTMLGYEPRPGLVDRAQAQEATLLLTDRVAWVDDEEVITLDGILARARRNAAQAAGHHAVFIDPWKDLAHDYPPHMREDTYIASQLTRLKRFVRQTGTAVFVLANTRKLNKLPRCRNVYDVPTPYDISGAAAWFNTPDWCITVWRDQTGERRPETHTDIFIQKCRRSAWGGRGRAQLVFDPAQRRYRDGPFEPITPY